MEHWVKQVNEVFARVAEKAFDISKSKMIKY